MDSLSYLVVGVIGILLGACSVYLLSLDRLKARYEAGKAIGHRLGYHDGMMEERRAHRWAELERSDAN